MADSESTNVTLGEVWRGLGALDTTVARMADSITALRTEISREIDVTVTARLGAVSDRVARLEKVLYGGVALVLAAVVTAVLGLVIKTSGS